MAVLGGVIGAKTYYVLLNYEAHFANPLSAIFSRGWNGVVRWFRGRASSYCFRDSSVEPYHSERWRTSAPQRSRSGMPLAG